MPTQEKIDSVEEFKTRLDGAKTVLVTEYRGLTVRQLSDLRKQLRGVSAQYKIMKNRLAKLAMTDSDLAKLGTVTFDVSKAVREAKAGKVEFRVDKAGNIHTPVGKKSFTPENIQANAMAVIEAIVRAKPSAAKGTYLRTVTLSTTMSPGVTIDAAALANLFKKAV